MTKIISFPAAPWQEQSVGMIKKQHMKVLCNGCGNTKKFYGRAMTHPMIVIERSDHDQHKYNVTEVGYSQAGHVDETIEQCAACGSKDIDIDFLKRDS